MTNKDESLYRALEAIKQLQDDREDDRIEIEKVNIRLDAYDLLAAKWGGVCMLAVALGSGVMMYSDKIAKWLVALTPTGKP